MDNKRTQLARNIEALCAGSRDENAVVTASAGTDNGGIRSF